MLTNQGAQLPLLFVLNWCTRLLLIGYVLAFEWTKNLPLDGYIKAFRLTFSTSEFFPF